MSTNSAAMDASQQDSMTPIRQHTNQCDIFLHTKRDCICAGRASASVTRTVLWLTVDQIPAVLAQTNPLVSADAPLILQNREYYRSYTDTPSVDNTPSHGSMTTTDSTSRLVKLAWDRPGRLLSVTPLRLYKESTFGTGCKRYTRKIHTQHWFEINKILKPILMELILREKIIDTDRSSHHRCTV
jgi:hypothetical protein